MCDKLLIVCWVATGDLFRVFPDGRACEITDEDELHEACGVLADLEPTRRGTAKLLDQEQGNEFWLCVPVTCQECDDGKTNANADLLDDDGWQPDTYCRPCNGSGLTYKYTNTAPVPRELLPSSPAAVAFLPLSLDSLQPEMTLDLTKPPDNGRKKGI
jgi:hypothetical protein